MDPVAVTSQLEAALTIVVRLILMMALVVVMAGPVMLKEEKKDYKLASLYVVCLFIVGFFVSVHLFP